MLTDELPFTLGITPPSSITKIRNNAEITNDHTPKVLIDKERGLRLRQSQTSTCIVFK